MFNNSQTRAFQSAFTSLQNRIASGLRFDAYEHSVFVSVSVSDKSGNVLQTIDTSQASSSWSVGYIQPTGQFASGIVLDTHEKRVAAMFEVAAHVWSLAADSTCVVSATFQDTVIATRSTVDYVAQCYMKDGKLIIKQVNVVDRSAKLHAAAVAGSPVSSVAFRAKLALAAGASRVAVKAAASKGSKKKGARK